MRCRAARDLLKVGAKKLRLRLQGTRQLMNKGEEFLVRLDLLLYRLCLKG